MNTQEVIWTKEEILQNIAESIRIARYRYEQIMSTPKRCRPPRQVERAEASLLTIEALGIKVGIIKNGTI